MDDRALDPGRSLDELMHHSVSCERLTVPHAWHEDDLSSWPLAGTRKAIHVALDVMRDPRKRMDAILTRARSRATWRQDPLVALETCWEARRMAQKENAPRLVAVADLDLGMCYLELGRTNEGLEAVQRAVRWSRTTGNILLRGCGELLLAHQHAISGNIGAALRGIDIATDLVAGGGGGAILATAIALRAEVEAMPIPVRPERTRPEPARRVVVHRSVAARDTIPVSRAAVAG